MSGAPLSRKPIVGVVHHASAQQHETPAGHPERADRIDAIMRRLDESGLLGKLDPHAPEPASRELVELVHEPALIDALEQLDRSGGGRIDLDTSMGPHSLDAALRATRGTADAVERVLSDEWSSAFVCMRPPGHHATPQRPMGFCLTNHIAIGARHAVRAGLASRVVIIDWDAHHGNGTQDAFWTDPDVLYVSLHQYPWYPGTGDATECGEGDGADTTINVPLPAGAAEDAYQRAFDEIIEPAVGAFGPDLVMVSAGFDAHHLDPLCMMRLTAGAFHRMTRRVGSYGRGPVCVLEGGYDLDGLAWSAGAMVSALLGAEPDDVPRAEHEPLDGHPEALRWVERAAGRGSP